MPSGGFPTQPDNGPASVRHRCALGMVAGRRLAGETGTKQVRIATSNGPPTGFCDAARTAMGLCFAPLSAGAVYTLRLRCKMAVVSGRPADPRPSGPCQP